MGFVYKKTKKIEECTKVYKNTASPKLDYDETVILSQKICIAFYLVSFQLIAFLETIQACNGILHAYADILLLKGYFKSSNTNI